MKIATFNLRCDNDHDGENRWQFRKGLVLDKLLTERPALVGFQEVLPCMGEFLKAHMTGYLLVGSGRGVNYDNESNLIAFRTDLFELMSLETFWLSPTPDVPGSRYADQSGCPRICTHVILRALDGSGLFHYYNTHLDHISESARALGAGAILDHIARDTQRFPLPLLLTGDMNDSPESEPIRMFLNDPRGKLTNLTPDCTGSYHAFGQLANGNQIDFVLSRGFAAVGKPEAWGMTEFGKYLSDHNALCVDVKRI